MGYGRGMEETYTVEQDDYKDILKHGMAFARHVLECADQPAKESAELFGDDVLRTWRAQYGAFQCFDRLKYAGSLSDGDGLSQSYLFLATFIAGVQLTRAAIIRGFYIRAFALLRQEFEHASRIRLFRDAKYEILPDGRFAGRKPPHPKPLDEVFGKLYGNLSEVAHVASVETMTYFGTVAVPNAPEIDGEGMLVPMLEPNYKPGTASSLMSLHMVLCGHVCQDLAAFAEKTGDHDTAVRIHKANFIASKYMAEFSSRTKNIVNDDGTQPE